MAAVVEKTPAQQQQRTNPELAKQLDGGSQVAVDGAKSRSNSSSFSSHSSNSTQSATTGEMSSAQSRLKSHNSTSRFKEKRPEPLKLNAAVNQEIPLDLSVKSAGNIPSGTTIFNLTAALTNHQTLETPRIVWQDNETLLIKPQLFSSSSNSNNASSANQRIRLSSLIGDSPPMTPVTPFRDSPKSLSAQVSLLFHPDSPLLANHYKQPQQRHQPLRDCNQQQQQHQQSDQPPRRSYSTESLSGLYSNGELRQKPARFQALKQVAANRTPLNSSRFSYSAQSKEVANKPTSPKSQPESSNSLNQPATPTSVTNATANLLNIHLNSPTNQSQSQMVGLDPLMSAAYSQQRSSLNSAFSSTSSYSDQFDNSKQAYANYLANNHYFQSAQQQQQQVANCNSQSGFPSCSTSLNTPTLISPSQLKSSLCYLSSPSLSPMFGPVFELPSPLLMVPPSQPMQLEPTRNSTLAKLSPQVAASRMMSDPGLATCDELSLKHPHQLPPTEVGECCRASSDLSLAQSSSVVGGPAVSQPRANHSMQDLAHLITSASDKVGANNKLLNADHHHCIDQLVEDAVQMDVDKELAAVETLNSTLLPKIFVSDCVRQASSLKLNQNSHLESSSVQQRAQREPLGKRALSPQSFRHRVSLYHNQRLESCSAPPDVQEIRARPKLKTVPAGHSCASLHQPDQVGMAQHHFWSSSAAPYPPELLPCRPAGNSSGALSILQHQPHQHQQHSSVSTGDLPRMHSHQSGGQLEHLPTANCQSANPCRQQQVDQLQSYSYQQHQQSDRENFLILSNTHSNYPGLQTRPTSADADLEPDRMARSELLLLSSSGAGRGENMQTTTGSYRSVSALAGNLNGAPATTAAKKYHCDQCPKSFTRSDMLTRHKRLHSGDRPFQCNECKQEFSRSDHLSTHMRTHTGEKPYKCKLCAYSACRKDMITRHMKVHNRSSPSA